jgi:hypothetical protein
MMTSNTTTITDGPLPDARAKEVSSAGIVPPNRSPSETRNPVPTVACNQEIPLETTIVFGIVDSLSPNHFGTL